MKLGEAKNRLDQIESQVTWCEKALAHGPLAKIGDSLDEGVTILKEYNNLKKRIADTEAMTAVEGNVLSEMQTALWALHYKIRYLDILFVREDLEKSQKENIFGQLKILKATKISLGTSINRCLWETELLDE